MPWIGWKKRFVSRKKVSRFGFGLAHDPRVLWPIELRIAPDIPSPNVIIHGRHLECYDPPGRSPLKRAEE